MKELVEAPGGDGVAQTATEADNALIKTTDAFAVSTIAEGYQKLWNDILSRWWDPDNHRIYGQTGSYLLDNTRPFQWAMANLHISFYWKAKGGDSDAATKVAQNFSDALAFRGATVLGTASFANDIGGSDDFSWTLQWLCQVHDITGSSTALTVASNLFASGTVNFADPANRGAGLLYVSDSYAATVGHYRVSATNDVFTAISALYLDEKLGQTSRRAFATHTYDWVKAYAIHPLGVLYCEVDVDPAHPGTPKAIDTTPPSPIKPHFSATTISFSFAFMTLCKKLYDINPNPQFITDINNMMASILRPDTFLRPGDVLCPDRDGWGNGLGFPQFVHDVLPMPGLDADLVSRMKQAIVNTALEICNNRTYPYYYNEGVHFGEGLYGADWNGPEIGTNGILTWFQTGNNAPPNSGGDIALPEQIMTNGSTACVVSAASMIADTQPISEVVTRGELATLLQQFAQSYVPTLGGVTIRDDVTFQSNLTGKYVHADPLSYFTVVSPKVILAFDNNDQFDYDRSTNQGRYVIGGAEAFTFNATDAVFPGNLTGKFVKADAYSYLTVSGTKVILALDSNDQLEYDRSANRGRFLIGGTEAFGFTATDGLFPGNLTAKYVKADALSYLTVSGTRVILAFDINDQLDYDRSTNRVRLLIGGTEVLAVTSSGVSSGGSFTLGGVLTANSGITMSGSLISSGGCQFNGATIGGVCQPSNDNAVPLGAPARRWSVVYAGSGAINTSDAREKTWRGSLSPDELAAAKAISASIGVYQFNAALREKGSEGARLHAGVAAQTIGAIMRNYGLDPHRYAWFCYDEWNADAGRPATQAVEEQPEIKDAAGDIIQHYVAAVPADPGLPPHAAGGQFGVRYDELAMFLIAAQEQRLAALEDR